MVRIYCEIVLPAASYKDHQLKLPKRLPCSPMKKTVYRILQLHFSMRNSEDAKYVMSILFALLCFLLGRIMRILDSQAPDVEIVADVDDDVDDKAAIYTNGKTEAHEHE